MKRFYKYQNGDNIRYYTNLTKLCEQEQLNYTNVYHAVNRLKNDVWRCDGVSVSVLFFQ